MRYSFDAINTKGICDKIKHTIDRDLKMDPSYLQITAQMNVKKNVVDINKKIQLLVLAFLTNY